MSVFKDGLIRQGAAGAGDAAPYEISQSIIFNQADDASMMRTPSSASNKRTWSFSWWWKRGNLSGSTNGTNQRQPIFGTTAFSILSNHNSTQIDGINVVYTGSANDIQTNEKFRDVSGWYHFVFVLDTTQTVDSERVRLYKNGERITSFASITYPSLNTEYTVNNTQAHYIGLRNSGENLDGYLAEINFVDGYAYGPEFFGEFNSNNIWVPKEYTGSYGTNGFFIDGRDSSDLGDDESGNGNDFSTTNMTASDQSLDTPTNNFCVINRVYGDASGLNDLNLSNGNLQIAGTSGNFDVLGYTFNLPKTGKWYFEYLIGGLYDGWGFVIVGEEASISGGNGIGQVSASQGGAIQYQGWIQGASYATNFGATFTAGHIHQVAIDVDNNKLYYGINNTYYAQDAGTDGNPSAGTNHLDTFDFNTNDIVLMTHQTTGSAASHHNFGQNGTFNGQKTAQGNTDANGHGNFFYAVPTNYLALCTKNLQA